jgi:hypothetical protein
MQDVFKPNSLTIKELFGNADSLYQIPIYQRPYKWGTDQVEKLWEDLFEAFENDEPNYFLGSVITAKPQETSNYLDIVDGQQRLTTLLILFCCYRDTFPNINSSAAEIDPFAIDSNILKNSILFNDKFNRLRLITHSSHQSDFDQYIIKGNTRHNKFPSRTKLNRDEEPKYKFMNTSAIFCESLLDMDEEHAGKFLNYIFNKVKIIRIDCASVSFAIKLFQVLNDRGLDLTNSDLIKSFLLEKIYKNYSSDVNMQKQKSDQFISDWKETENIINDTDIVLNDAFILYEYYLLGSNPKQSLYDEMQQLFVHRDPNQVIADFKEFCRHYRNDIYYKEDKLTYSFWYIRWSIYWKSILLTAFHTEYSDTSGLMILLRRYYYLSWFAGFTLSKIKQLSFNIIKWVKESQPLSFIEKEINAKMDADDVINRAKDSLDDDIYYYPWCKPLLFLIEYNQTDDSHLKYLDVSDREIHVEHVVPRKFSYMAGWNGFKKDEYIQDWINSAGNLTLLSGKKNIEASNNDLEVKIDVYTGKGKYKDEDKKITAFRITQKIVDDYHSSKYNREWNWHSIIDRWNWFCDEVEQLFDIDLSDRRYSYDDVVAKNNSSTS